jgi:hypothetical protein
MVWSSLFHRVVQEDSYKVYFVLFLNFLYISTNFGSLNDFQEYLNKIHNWKRIKRCNGPTLADGLGPADHTASSA